MASYQRLILTLPASTVNFVSQANLHAGMGPHEGLQGIINYLKSINGGVRQGNVAIATGEVFAAATMTNTAAAVAAETFSIANVVFTARASGATGNEFNLSAVAATQATNIKNSINSSTSLAGIVTATSALGVVTITAVAPGKIGNSIQFSESLTGVAITQFASGADGTSYTMNLS